MFRSSILRRLASSETRAARTRRRTSSRSVDPAPTARLDHARRTSARLLDGLLDLAGLQAACADVRPRRLAAQDHADTLEVRVEAPLGGDHRVASVVPEARLLPADCADLGHRRAT